MRFVLLYLLVHWVQTVWWPLTLIFRIYVQYFSRSGRRTICWTSVTSGAFIRSIISICSFVNIKASFFPIALKLSRDTFHCFFMVFVYTLLQLNISLRLPKIYYWYSTVVTRISNTVYFSWWAKCRNDHIFYFGSVLLYLLVFAINIADIGRNYTRLFKVIWGQITRLEKILIRLNNLTLVDLKWPRVTLRDHADFRLRTIVEFLTRY